MSCMQHGNGTEDILTSSTHRQSFQFISIHSKRAFPNPGHKSRFPHVVNLPIEVPASPSLPPSLPTTAAH